MSGIKFIYFDVGGVVIKDFSDTNKWQELQKDLGINETTQDKFDQIWQTHRDEISIDYDIDSYIPILRSELGLSISENYSMLDDFVERFEKNNSIWEIIEKAKSKLRIGLITNMYPRMLDKIFDAKLLPPINWDIILDSSIVKMKKPMLDFYDLATSYTKIPSDEILFIDNKKEFIIPAAELGWQTFFYDSKDYEKSSLELAKFLHHT